MSSFPILRLPDLALRNAVGNWTPNELYFFSTLSRKTKTIAKCLSKTPLEMGVLYGDRNKVRIKYGNPDRYNANIYEFHRGTTFSDDCEMNWYFRVSDKVVIKCYKMDNVLFRSQTPSIDILKVAEEIQEVFRCTKHHIMIYQDSNNDLKTSSLVSWINSLEQESISKVSINTSHQSALFDFIQNIQKPIEEFHIQNTSGSLPNTIKEFPKGIINSIKVYPAEWIGIQELMSMDFIKGDFNGISLESKEINRFLKSWKNGETHSRMEKCHFIMKKHFDLRVVLDGLAPTFEDPDTINSVRGKCEIQGSNGKVARIEFHKNRRIPDKFTITIL